MESKIDLRELLEYIDPAQCSYEEWLNVGLALHQEGYPYVRVGGMVCR